MTPRLIWHLAAKGWGSRSSAIDTGMVTLGGGGGGVSVRTDSFTGSGVGGGERLPHSMSAPGVRGGSSHASQEFSGESPNNSVMYSFQGRTFLGEILGVGVGGRLEVSISSGMVYYDAEAWTGYGIGLFPTTDCGGAAQALCTGTAMYWLVRARRIVNSYYGGAACFRSFT